MAVTGLSEFTFGFAFLFEQAQRSWSGLRAAPILPSLRQEADIGWDAHLPAVGKDFYYQFKLSDYLSRGNAKFIRDGTYDSAYYRVALHARDLNRQHQRLRAHAAKHKHTYYVAPEFQLLEEFNSSYLASEITEHSRLIRVADCDDITDGDQHYLTYCAGKPEWRQHSEAKRHERSIPGRSLDILYGESRESWHPLNLDFAKHLLESTTVEIEENIRHEMGNEVDMPVLRVLDETEGDGSRTSLLRKTADLLAVFYGVTLVLVGTPG